MFLILLIIGVVLYFALKGKAAPAVPMRSAPSPAPKEPGHFVCPHPKCLSCGAPADGMKQAWDGLRTVKWTCAYCGTPAPLQTLKDEELPLSARQALGQHAPPQPGAYPPQGSGLGVGTLLTGLVIGSMLSDGDHHCDHDSSDWDN